MKSLSQKDRLKNLLNEGYPVRTDKIVEIVYGKGLGLARVGARVNDLKHEGLYIIGWKDRENPSLYWYTRVFDDQIAFYEKNIERGLKPMDAYFQGLKDWIINEKEHIIKEVNQLQMI